jgi:hypothetical protein
VANEIGGAVPIVAKLSYLPFAELQDLVGALDEYVAGFSGINTLQVQVDSPTGGPTFGDRKHAGLSGVALRHLGVDFVRSLQRLRQENEVFDYEIIGMGGVMTPADADALLWIGADAVQTATGASVNPSFPSELVKSGTEHHPADEATVERIRAILYAPDGSFRTADDLGQRLGLDPEIVERELNPAGELDLPRRVFELLSLDQAYGINAIDARGGGGEPNARAWGPEPSARDLDEVAGLDDELLKEEYDRLLESAVTGDELAELLGLSIEEFERAVRDKTVVGLEVNGRVWFPLWQTTEEQPPRVLPAIRELSHAFGDDALALSAWATLPNPHLKGRAPYEVLGAGDVESVLAAIASIGAAAY